MLFEMETLDFLGNMLTCFHYKSNSLLTSTNYAQVEQNISEAQMEVSQRKRRQGQNGSNQSCKEENPIGGTIGSAIYVQNNGPTPASKE